jgi:hypothetical protein
MGGMVKRRAPMLVLLLAAGGCTTHNPLAVEAVSFGAGEAVAANTVMQIVDPWPPNRQYTDIAVPADRDQYRPRPANGSAGYVDGGPAEAGLL